MKFESINYVIILLSLLVSCKEEPLMKKTDIPSEFKSGDFFIQADLYSVGKSKYQSHSGIIIVPENRSKADSRLIEIPFIQIHATGDSVAQPIFFMGGGPGSPNIDSYFFVNNLIENHDIVLVGYRGTEGSVVVTLPEIDMFFADMPGDLTEKPAPDLANVKYGEH